MWKYFFLEVFAIYIEECASKKLFSKSSLSFKLQFIIFRATIMALTIKVVVIRISFFNFQSQVSVFLPPKKYHLEPYKAYCLDMIKNA